MTWAPCRNVDTHTSRIHAFRCCMSKSKPLFVSYYKPRKPHLVPTLHMVIQPRNSVTIQSYIDSAVALHASQIRSRTTTVSEYSSSLARSQPRDIAVHVLFLKSFQDIDVKILLVYAVNCLSCFSCDITETPLELDEALFLDRCGASTPFGKGIKIFEMGCLPTVKAELQICPVVADGLPKW